MTTQLIPLQDRILGVMIAPESVTETGIVVPDTAQDRPDRAKVVQVGAGKPNDIGDPIPPVAQVGDIVVFGKYGSTPIKIDNTDYVIIKESDCFLIIRENNQ